jgi:LCP family protein required for cell wall assembly
MAKIIPGNMSGYGRSGDAPGGAPRQPHRPRQPGRAGALAWRLAGWLAVVLVVLLVASCLGAYVTYRNVWSSIHRIDITGLGRPPPRYNDALNILLIGSDTRTGQNRQFGAGIGGQRSDTIMLLHISPGHRRATVVSIPRDTMVPYLGCPPEGPGTPGQRADRTRRERINQAFAAGGPGCLWETVEHQTGIRVDHFIELTFTGFEHVIDDIGGVSICLPVAVDDPYSGLNLPAGLHRVRGAQALAFWRERHIGLGSDLQRIRRDHYLLAAIVRDAAHSAILRSPARLYALIRDIASAMTTDAGLGQATLLTIAASMPGLSSSSVQFITAPEVPYPADPQAEVQFAQPQARALFAAIARDRALPPSRQHSTQGAKRGTQEIKLGARGVSSSRPPGQPSPPASSGPSPTARAGAPARADAPAGPSPARVGGLARSYGGITAAAPSCGDQAAFAGTDSPSDFPSP